MNVLQTTPKSSYTPYNCKLSDVLKTRAQLAGFGISTSIFVQDDRIGQVVAYDNYYLDQSPETVGYFILRQTDSDENHVVSRVMEGIENKSTAFEKFCEIWAMFKTGYQNPEMWFFSIQEFRDGVNNLIEKKLG